MSKTILITGASGLIGSVLSNFLIHKGYKVNHLSRRGPNKNSKIKTFKWDVYNKRIDPNCINNTDIIIHLAGEGIAQKAWTNKRKHEIIESRTESIRLIYSLLKKRSEHQVKAIISASGIGYYSDRGDELLNEESPPASDFLGESCTAWEQAVDEGKSLGLRTVKFRTGVVLSKTGGALKQIARPVKLGLGSALGSGRQWISWIHIEDVIRMYLFAIENEKLEGAFNMCSPNSVTNSELTKAIAKQLNKPLWLPKVPSFMLRTILGEMSKVVLGSTKTSADKIKSEGFEFHFPDIAEALADIYD